MFPGWTITPYGMVLVSMVHAGSNSVNAYRRSATLDYVSNHSVGDVVRLGISLIGPGARRIDGRLIFGFTY